MGKLKPIGSEKLEGTEKILRMIELSTYKLNTPKPINETKSNEYKKLLADGSTYHIVREKNGYIIKKGLNESNSVYIEPIKNRKYYPSYSQALKRLNIIANEVSRYEGYDRNISLFLEDDREVEFYLTTEQEETPGAEPAVPAPDGGVPPSPEGGTPPPPPSPEGEIPPAPEGEEMPDMGDEGMDTEPSDEGEEEEVTFKTIQKATGKLAQKIRTFLSDEENEMSSKDIKYVINSVLSALNLEDLDEDDMDEIMNRFEGGGEEEGMEDEEMPEPEGEMPPAPESEMPPAPEGEMPPAPPAPPAGGEMTEFYPKHGARDKRKEYFDENEMFTESSVDRVLNRYFKTNKEKPQNIDRVLSFSQSYIQENTVKSFLKKYPKAQFLGKSEKNNLIFSLNETKIKITPKGNVL
jgi:hypothetical protein